MHHRSFGVFLATLLASAAGCSSSDDDSAPGSAGSSGTSSASDAAYGLSPECIRCVVRACDETYNACSSKPPCQSMMDCALDCHDQPACLDTCRSANPDGSAAWNLMYACVQSNCEVCITPR